MQPVDLLQGDLGCGLLHQGQCGNPRWIISQHLSYGSVAFALKLSGMALLWLFLSRAWEHSSSM